jgi:hypothetical protein
MANETAQVVCANKVIFDSIGAHHTTKKVETATSMYPGTLVKRGTNDDDIVCATAGSDAYGWIGYEDTAKKYRQATVTTICVQNDQVDVFWGPGVVFAALIANGQTITKGERLVTTAAGELAAATAAAPASGTVAVVSTGAQPTMAGPLPTSGIVVATAEESVTTSGANARKLVRSLI